MASRCTTSNTPIEFSGLDISQPLIEVASNRAVGEGIDNVAFLVADAQTHGFADGEFSLIVSQFGLMFFDDPEGAFSNLRRALVPGGRLSFVCWQDLVANEWLMVVGRAVAEHGDLPGCGGRCAGPGMFALKRPDETVALLEAAGFTEVEVEPTVTTVLLAGGADVDASLEFPFGMGMVRGLLGRLSADDRPRALDGVRADLVERYEPDVGVSLGAAGWLVSAGNR